MGNDGGPQPITADDEYIRRALEQAEMAALLPALACATGDLGLLRDEFEVSTEISLVPATMPDAELAEARQLAFEALVRLRDGGGELAPLPGDESLRRMLQFCIGGGDVEDEYLPLFEEELGIGEHDRRGPDWTLEQIGAATGSTPAFDAVIIGAGMSGLLAAHRLDQAGVPFVILEKNDDVGGTWLENTYPGCRVDVPNHFYSYSFAQRDDWPQHFSTQDVLLDYFRTFADEAGLRSRVRFGVEVTGCTWDDRARRWTVAVRAGDGTEETLSANAVISAVGQLNRPSFPDIPGQETFRGPSFHSARWDHGVDLAGQRVAVIGTGASAAQFVPVIAEQVGELTVFQRTPPWLAPTEDYYQDTSPEMSWLFRHVPYYAAWHRFWLFWRNAEGMLPLVQVSAEWEPKTESVSELNEMLRLFLVEYLRQQFADRPDLFDQVVPHYPPGAKRVVRDDGIWARTLMRDNVHLVGEKILEITPTGVRTVDGVDHEADVLIYGTGFTASQFLTPMRVVGRDGVELHDRWHGDARAYLGVTVPGFPNLFLLYGPNTNIVINGSIIFFSECEVRYLMGCLRLVLEGGHRALDCRPEAHDEYNRLIDEGNLQMAWGVADVPSWYRNATGRSAQNWPFTLLEYWKRTRAPDPAAYELID